MQATYITSIRHRMDCGSALVRIWKVFEESWDGPHEGTRTRGKDRGSMPRRDERTIEREVTIAASPQTVWEFLVDPEKARCWMGTLATLHAVVGGEYRVQVVPGNTAAGEFVEVDKPHRLVHTWGWEPGAVSHVEPGASTVEYELI